MRRSRRRSAPGPGAIWASHGAPRGASRIAIGGSSGKLTCVHTAPKAPAQSLCERGFSAWPPKPKNPRSEGTRDAHPNDARPRLTRRVRAVGNRRPSRSRLFHGASQRQDAFYEKASVWHGPQRAPVGTSRAPGGRTSERRDWLRAQRADPGAGAYGTPGSGSSVDRMRGTLPMPADHLWATGGPMPAESGQHRARLEKAAAAARPAEHLPAGDAEGRVAWRAQYGVPSPCRQEDGTRRRLRRRRGRSVPLCIARQARGPRCWRALGGDTACEAPLASGPAS